MRANRVDIDHAEVDRLIKVVEVSRSIIQTRKEMEAFIKGHTDRMSALEKKLAFDEMELMQLRAKDATAVQS
jgi:hypothetical protein